MPYALRALGAPVFYNNTNSYMVLIGGQQVEVIAGSLKIDSTIGRRSQASFVVRTTTATHFQQYQQVVVYDKNSSLVFSGYITNPKEQKPGFQPSLLHSITCTDQHFLADKRRVTASYTNKTCGFIAQDIVKNVLSQENVTVGQIYDGPTPNTTLYPSTSLYPGGNVALIPQANFVYASVAQALDALVKAASSSGVPYYWQIDANKQIWFVPYTSIVNNTLVDGSQIEQVRNAPTVTRANPTYRNTQYIIGGVAQTVQQTETRVGDGNTQSWTMGYALASTPTITVGGVAQTVGLKGTSGKQFYWAQGDPVITQDSGQTKLTSAQTLQVVYIGQYPAVIVDQNAAQVTLEASIDGTSGIIEDVVADATITSINNGMSEAGQLLTLYAQQGITLQFTTLSSVFAQGQLITVNLPMHGLYNTQMLISQVSAGDQIDGYNIWFTVTAVAGPYDTTWIDFFSKALQQQIPQGVINVGASQSVAILLSMTASVTPTANLNINVYACPLVSTTLYPSTSLYPC